MKRSPKERILFYTISGLEVKKWCKIPNDNPVPPQLYLCRVVCKFTMCYCISKILRIKRLEIQYSV